MNTKTKKKYLKIIEIYDRLIVESGDYAPYLSRQYYIDNTINEYHNLFKKDISRRLIYEALQFRKSLKQEEKFLDAECK